MNFRIFALTLAASLALASSAGAVERKHHPRMQDRDLSARSDTHVWRYERAAPQPDTSRDPLNSSANGS